MKAIAVRPGTPDSVHLADLAKPAVIVKPRDSPIGGEDGVLRISGEVEETTPRGRAIDRRVATEGPPEVSPDEEGVATTGER